MFTIRVKNFLLPINNLELCTWWFSFLSIPYELQHCQASITISINCQYLIGKVKNNFTTILLQYRLFMGFFPWTQFYSNMFKVYEASWNIYWFTLKSPSFLVHLPLLKTFWLKMFHIHVELIYICHVNINVRTSNKTVFSSTIYDTFMKNNPPIFQKKEKKERKSAVACIRLYWAPTEPN